jgi:UrcA family protein
VFTKRVHELHEQAAPSSFTGSKQMNAVVTKSALTLTLAAALCWPVVSAHAERIEGVTVSSAPTLRVSYAELDINKPRGLEVLYSRIERAAKTVCNYEYGAQQLARMRQAKACFQTAVDDAVRQINRPTLTALHRAKTGAPLG